MTPEHRDIPDWARRERQADLGWIAESLNVVSAVASVAFVDTSRMVAEYDPAQEFVIVLLKHEDRTSTDWVGFVPPGHQSVKRQTSNVIGFRKRYVSQQTIQRWIAFTIQLVSFRLFSKPAFRCWGIMVRRSWITRVSNCKLCWKTASPRT
jgi:hypothetical protein